MRSIRISWIPLALLALLVASGCAGSADDSDPEPSSNRGDRPPGAKGDYFGADDRSDPVDEGVTDRQRRWARSTALLAEADDIVEDDEGNLTLDSTPYKEDRNLCEDARFADQPVVPNCSSFLVDDDTVVTAGHCTAGWTFSCEKARFVFDYGIYEEGEDPTAVDEQDVYRCEEVVTEKFEGSELDQLDYSVVRLDREVEDREPLEVRRRGRAGRGAHLALIGYPDGLPVKIDDDGVIFHTTDRRFVATNDSFGGHSGGAVVNLSTGKIEAVHVASGGQRFERDEENDCRRPRQCQKAEVEGECQGSIGVYAEHWRRHLEGYGGRGDVGPDGGSSDAASRNSDAGASGTDAGGTDAASYAPDAGAFDADGS